MNVYGKMKSFLTNSRHIIDISYKPQRKEYDRSAKIIIIGILLLGAMGFIIALIISLLVTGTLSMI
jgi:protein translocase SEC61 complex gamma subunit